ncbi:hypothetical protein MKX01_014378 [Papaver californicum]|nr:hypothetical protein MKX01_014378 [Papaver californicum]
MESLFAIPLPPPSFLPPFGQSNSYRPINRFGHGNDPLKFSSISAWFGGHGNDPLEFPSLSASHSCFATLTAKTSMTSSSSSSSGVLARATTRGGGFLYDVLGVSPSATSDEIRSSYRKLALRYHPDVSKQANAQEKFIRIKNACDTLLDSDSRRQSFKVTGAEERTYYYGIGNLSESRRNGGGGASSTSKNQSRKGTYDEDYYSNPMRQFYGFGTCFMDYIDFMYW